MPRNTKTNKTTLIVKPKFTKKKIFFRKIAQMEYKFQLMKETCYKELSMIKSKKSPLSSSKQSLKSAELTQNSWLFLCLPLNI